MSRPLTLGFSPCPNDTTVFHALVHGRVAPELSWAPRLDDVEALNRAALGESLDVVKVSVHAFAHVADQYCLLPAGGALGRGVGPLIVSRDSLPDLRGRRVATPGGLTTAHLLLALSQPPDVTTVQMRFDRILPAVAAGEVDAGVIIHEGRFTYGGYGLLEHLDLGSWWEAETGRPLPLGAIAARRALGAERLARVSAALRASVAWAEAHPADAEGYVAEHAQELSPEVRRRHVELYVNEFTLDLGEEGRAAVHELLARAAARGIVAAPREPFLREAAA